MHTNTETMATSNGTSNGNGSILDDLPATFWGERGRDGKRVGFLKRPTFERAAEAALAKFHAHGRADFEMRADELRMGSSGRLFAVSGAGDNEKQTMAPVGQTYGAFAQLCGRIGVPAGGTGYLRESPASLRAYNVNHWAREAGATTMLVRTAKLGEGDERLAYGCLSQRYSRFDADKIINLVRELAPEGARASIGFDGARLNMDITWMDMSAGGRKVGDQFVAGVRARAADDGTAPIVISGYVGRLICSNGATLTTKSSHVSARHSIKDLEAAVRAGFAKAIEALGEFPKLWTEAAKDSILDGVYEMADPTPIFRALVHGDYIKVPGTDTDEMVNRLKASWDKEPGYTRADLVNAITRAAHENTWASPWTQTSLEEQAGKLLYQHVIYSPERDSLRFQGLDLN